MTRLYIAADHGGFHLKQALISYLVNYDVVDLGTESEESVDYPLYSDKIAACLKQDAEALGILICGTGLGVCMAVNRHRHIRAARCSTGLDAELARRHNNANVLCLGGRVIGVELAKHIVNHFLNSAFEGGRHQRRVNTFSTPAC
ncbi:ribose 5-phosphate isomerase B [Candidatus Odyssella thessalonicensis]|uniref:ribose 5-phosphate isomerase B n=1 Tax=Candidatus Odyssella thessalonicensis TaxID=84647 RepID=UPI000225C20E|nr:ribose 5-phosphate isomerase B [Candidatus Odyssella thessalonicensis]